MDSAAVRTDIQIILDAIVYPATAGELRKFSSVMSSLANTVMNVAVDLNAAANELEGRPHDA